MQRKIFAFEDTKYRLENFVYQSQMKIQQAMRFFVQGLFKDSRNKAFMNNHLNKKVFV